MPKIERKTQKIFGGNAESDQLAVFGSMITGTPVYNDDIETLQSEAYTEGWQVAVAANEAPFMEELNGVQYGFSKQLAYLFQQGIAEWDAGTTYYLNSFCQVGGVIYKSMQDENFNHSPADDTEGTYWTPLETEGGGGAGMPVGTIFAHTCSASFVPENSLPCNGTEYEQSQFPTLYTDWLVGGKLNTCTYEEYEQEITSTGECLKWGLDVANSKFKVPTKLNQILATDNSIPVKGNGMAIGLTNGSKNAGLDGNSSSLGTSTGQYGVNAGTGGSSHGDLMGAIGLTLDSSKSGIETDAANTTFKEIRFFVVVATGSIKQSEMDWSQWASSLQSKLNADHSNDTKPYITETYVNGTSGYVVYSNGLCEQWGISTIDSTYTTINLTKTYRDADYMVLLTFNDQTNVFIGGYPLCSRSKKASFFVIADYNKVSTATYKGWYTKGYIL